MSIAARTLLALLAPFAAIACVEQPPRVPDLVQIQEQTFLAVLQRRVPRSSTVYCLVVDSGAVTVDPAPAVLAGLTQRGLPVIPASRCLAALGYPGPAWEDGGLHDTIVVRVILHAPTRSPRLDAIVEHWVGPHAGSRERCEFERRGSRWQFLGCKDPVME